MSALKYRAFFQDSQKIICAVFDNVPTLRTGQLNIIVQDETRSVARALRPAYAGRQCAALQLESRADLIKNLREYISDKPSKLVGVASGGYPAEQHEPERRA
jgi:hypothetical protein